jgi:hypothetical protein
MADKADFLETEKVVHNLSEELSKLKSAVDQIEDTKNSAKTIEESANNIVCGATELVDIGKTIFTTGEKILDRVDKVKFTERFDEVEKLGTESVENIDRLQKHNSRLSIGIMGLLVLQAITLVFLFLR